MTGSSLRRLTKLETVMHPTETLDLAAVIEAGRRAVRTKSPAELDAGVTARLAEMRACHAERPLRGLALDMLHGLERVHAGRAAA